jgi:hypothetical protein
MAVHNVGYYAYSVDYSKIIDEKLQVLLLGTNTQLVDNKTQEKRITRPCLNMAAPLTEPKLKTRSKVIDR